MRTIINSDNKVNIMMLVYASKLDLQVCCTNVEAKKIDSSNLKTFEMILVSFQEKDKLKKTQFF